MTRIQRQVNECLAKYVSGLAADEPVPDWVYELGQLARERRIRGKEDERVIERDVGFAAVVPIDMEVPEYVRNVRKRFS